MMQPSGIALTVLAFALAASDSRSPRSTFRVGRASCQRCDIGALVKKEAGAGAMDCGWAKSPPERSVLNECVLGAIAAKKDFFALTSTYDVDSGMVIGLVARKGSLRKLDYYDAST